MAPAPKLTGEQVEAIRLRVRNGEQKTDLAREFGVDRKTIHRRVDELERAATKQAERVAAERRRKQAVRERRKLLERDKARVPPLPVARRPVEAAIRTSSARQPDPYHAWLEIPKNLSGRGLAEAHGAVRLCNPEGTVRQWVEPGDVDNLLEEGWTLA